MIYKIIILFGWLLFIANEVTRDYHTIEIEKENINHKESWTLRAVVGILFNVILCFSWQFMLAQIFTFWFLFNVSLNLARPGKPFNYLGSNFWDRNLKKLGNTTAYWILFLLMFFSIWLYLDISTYIDSFYDYY